MKGNQEEKQRSYTATLDRLFVLQAAITVVAMGVYLASGASERLALGLQTSFGDSWLFLNAIYIAVTIFGYSVFIFPLVYYSDYGLEQEFELEPIAFGNWLKGYMRGLVLDICIGTFVFSIIYILLRASPEWWWVLAASLYLLTVTGLDVLLPLLLSSFLPEEDAFPDTQRTGSILNWCEKLGLRAKNVQVYGSEDSPANLPVMLSGPNKAKTILIDRAALPRFSLEEIQALIAHEIARIRMHAKRNFMAISVFLSAIGFYAAHLCLKFFVSTLSGFGVERMEDIAGFPILIFSLFVFVLITMPLLNLYSHRQIFRADAFAVRACKSADPLVDALNKTIEHESAHSNPATWVEIFFHRIPSVERRIEQARREETFA